MEIKCICVDDTNRPKEIPKDKWVKKGQEYTIIFAIVVLPQRELGIQLDEIDLDESCAPYEYFLAKRFGFRFQDLGRLAEFIDQCGQVNLSMQELMEELQYEGQNS